MYRARVIPCLLLSGERLVKTVRFKQPTYVGDPINAVKIFNEKEVDELIVLDIDATVNNVEPDYVMIRNLAAECRMPLCYGGGVKSLAQAVKISRQLKLMIPLDLIVRTREQVNERLAMDDFFMREIVERGKVMYEAPHR